MLTYRLDDLQIVDVVSRGVLLRSLLVRRRISRHGLRATVVVDTVYIGESCRFIFPVRTVDTWKERKRSPVQRIRSSRLFLDYVQIDLIFRTFFDSSTSLTRVFSTRARTESTERVHGAARELNFHARQMCESGEQESW